MVGEKVFWFSLVSCHEKCFTGRINCQTMRCLITKKYFCSFTDFGDEDEDEDFEDEDGQGVRMDHLRHRRPSSQSGEVFFTMDGHIIIT